MFIILNDAAVFINGFIHSTVKLNEIGNVALATS